jgi:hypothetical protein
VRSNIKKCLLFADDAKIHRGIKSPYGIWLLQSDILNVCVWCVGNYMKLKVNKARFISCWRKTNWHGFDNKLCAPSITHTNCIRNLGVFIGWKFHFQLQIYNIFCQAISLLRLIRTMTVSFSSLHGHLKLYCTSVGPKLESVSVVWNSVTFSNIGNLKRIQRQFFSLHHHLFFSVTVLVMF